MMKRTCSMDLNNKPETVNCDAKQETNDGGEVETGLESSCKFDPPLYRQRYNVVAQILRNEAVKSVVDFGIAECNILQYFKGIDTVEHIVGVDIDQPLLQNHVSKIRPLTTDYLQPRENPLLVQLYCGSVVAYDDRLSAIEAITMVEVIEHLEPDILEQLPQSLFGRYKPDIVILTTPNSEFNVLFPNFSGFRHWDHKFEWTRQEFKDWCEPVASQYGYTVTYDGVGSGGEGTGHLGHCSQIAVFKKNQSSHHSVNEISDINGTDCLPYILISKCSHPSSQDSGYTEEEKILHEAEYYINMLRNDHKIAMENAENYYGSGVDQQNEDPSQYKIELADLLSFKKMNTLCDDIIKLGELLERKGYILSENRSQVIVSLDDDEDMSSGLRDEDYFEEDSRDYWNPDTMENDPPWNKVNTFEEEECWDNDVEVVPIPELKISKSPNLIEAQPVIELRQYCRRVSFDSDPKIGRTIMKENRWVYNEWEEWHSKDGYGQYSDADVISGSPMDLGGFCVGQDKSDSILNADCSNVIIKDSFKSDNDGFQDISISNNIVDIDRTKSELEPVSNVESTNLCDDNSQGTVNKNCDLESTVNEAIVKQDRAPPNGLLSIKEEYHDQPYLTLDNEITCKGCGCKMRKLKNGENLCGLSKACQSYFIEKFSQKFYNTVNVNNTDNEYLETGGQFSDADEWRKHRIRAL